MPELPELEVARKSVTPCVKGKKIARVLVAREKAVRTPREDGPAFVSLLMGHTVKKVERRGKALIFLLDRDTAMVFHFKLGALMACRQQAPDDTSGVAWSFAGGGGLEFTDLQLSEFHAGPASQLADLSILKGGIDPLDRSLTAERLREALPPGKQLKAALMDQSRISGIGNNYSDEILWNARLSPFRKVSSLSGAELEQLFAAMKSTLAESIKTGGEPGFRDAREKNGRYRERVHGRGGEACEHDGHHIEKVKKGRTFYYCPHCQL